MSDFNLDDDLVLDYLAESREHLATIETDLLSIEQAGAAIDEQLVNRVFRAAHSIKGGAGFFDLLQIKELAHRTESVLDLVRSRQMVPNSEIVSILLLAFDKLRNLILDYRNSNEADISEFTVALGRLTEDHLSPGKKKSPDEAVTIGIPGVGRRLVSSVFDLDQARGSGKNIYVIQYDLIHDVQRRGKTPLEVLNHLIKCGAILATAFDLDSAGTLDEEPTNRLLLDVLYATVLDGYSLTQILDVLPERVHRVEDNGAVLPIADLRAASPGTASPSPVAPPITPETSANSAPPPLAVSAPPLPVTASEPVEAAANRAR